MPHYQGDVNTCFQALLSSVTVRLWCLVIRRVDYALGGTGIQLTNALALRWPHLGLPALPRSPDLYAGNEGAGHFPPSLTLTIRTLLSGESLGAGRARDWLRRLPYAGCVCGGGVRGWGFLGCAKQIAMFTISTVRLREISQGTPRGRSDLWTALRTGGGARDRFPVTLVPPPRRGRGACPALVCCILLPQCANRSPRDGW